MTLVVGTNVILGSTAVYAEEPQKFTLDEYVVTATRTELSRKEVPQSVEVITKEDIQNIGATNVIDALRTATNIEIPEAAGVGHTLGIRGSGKNDGTEIPYAAYSADAFRSFLSTYTDSLNASFVPVEKIDKALVAEEVKKEYHEIAGRFSLVSPAGYLHPKPMLMPFLMSGVGVLGYMGPFFTEYNLNPDLLPVQYPFTYAHEMAHVLGISSEAEANLYGFLVCSRSGVPEIRFSAYFALLPYVLSNAYGLLSEEEFNEWKETISPEVKDLYNRKVAYWENLYSPFIGEIQSTVYNWFLKGNNISSGRKNYSEVVALLMALGNTSGEL